jgi:hypothetical protein
MSEGRKPTPRLQGTLQKPSKPPTQNLTRKPTVAQLQTAAPRAAQTKAPPVYRPQPTPRVLQTKLANAQPAPTPPRRTPTAPPVYRPELKKVVQPQMRSPAEGRKPPKAPPVYRPQPTPKVLQTKAAVTRPPHAPSSARTHAAPRNPLRPSNPTQRRGVVQAKASVTATIRPSPPSRTLQHPVALRPAHATGGRVGVVQLTDADVFVTGSSVRKGHGHCGLGAGAGGVSHAEQIAWAAAKSSVDAKLNEHGTAKVTVTFQVDQTICPLCQDWFEKTIYPYLKEKAKAKEKPFELLVTVGSKTVDVQGTEETAWPLSVGDTARTPIVEKLTGYLTETGGLGTDKMFVYNSSGDLEAIDYYSEQDIRDNREKIEGSYNLWQAFQESGTYVSGKKLTKDLDVEEVERLSLQKQMVNIDEGHLELNIVKAQS